MDKITIILVLIKEVIALINAIIDTLKKQE